jgi:hypothetical protein
MVLGLPDTDPLVRGMDPDPGPDPLVRDMDPRIWIRNMISVVDPSPHGSAMILVGWIRIQDVKYDDP